MTKKCKSWNFKNGKVDEYKWSEKVLAESTIIILFVLLGRPWKKVSENTSKVIFSVEPALYTDLTPKEAYAHSAGDENEASIA